MTSTGDSLSADQIARAKIAAVDAIGKASSLDALKEVKIEHIGDRSELAKANQALGKMEPQDRAEFGKVIGQGKT